MKDGGLLQIVTRTRTKDSTNGMYPLRTPTDKVGHIVTNNCSGDDN